jgi:hypothetical protein
LLYNNKLIKMWSWTIVIFVCLVIECEAQDPIVVLRQGTVKGVSCNEMKI